MNPVDPPSVSDQEPNRPAQPQSGTPQTPTDGFESVRRFYPPILNTAQVAELLDLNPRTVLNMAGDGRLPASRLPGSRKFHFLLEDIITTLKENRVATERDD
jgi:hypothetical protein